jgi:hypothetical protein
MVMSIDSVIERKLQFRPGEAHAGKKEKDGNDNARRG